VQWHGKPPAESNWMLLDNFRHAYPAFQLEDELLAQVGRYVIVRGDGLCMIVGCIALCLSADIYRVQES
jgi:hypothetical protein